MAGASSALDALLGSFNASKAKGNIVRYVNVLRHLRGVVRAKAAKPDGQTDGQRVVAVCV